LENSYQKFAKDVAVIATATFLTSLGTLIFLVLFTKTSGAYAYGIWEQVNVTVDLGIAFGGLSLPYALTRFLAAKKDKQEIQEEFYSVFCVVFLATLAVSFLLIIFANSTAAAFFGGAISIVRITGVIILVWSLDWACLSLFRAFRQMKRYSIFIVADIYGQIGLITYLLLSGHGILSVVLSILAIRAMLFFIIFFIMKSQIGIKRPHFSRIREYLNFSLPTIPASISLWVVASSDRYVIGYFLGAASVGIYSAGYRLGSIILMVGMILNFVLPPTVSKLYDEGKLDEVKTHLSYSLKYFLALAIPFIFGAALVGEQVMRIFSTPEIASQGYFIVPLVALAALLYGSQIVIAHSLILVKKTKIFGAIWTISALLNLLLNILLVPYMGILGAAIATVVAYSLALALITYYSCKEFRFNIEWSFILKSIVASIIMSLVIWRVNPERGLDVIFVIIGGIIMYAVLLLLMKGFKREESRFFRELFHN
jgi:O-antigen/teichoic acid export membrane protein